MRVDWTRLDAALARRPATVWWRDDDATVPSPALDRLLSLSGALDAPLTLAAIPAEATEALARRVAQAPSVTVAVHGWRHANHAPEGEKKAEFGDHRPADPMRAEAWQGLALLGDLFGARTAPVFVPPWNRFAPDLPDMLAEIGYRGFSAYAQRLPTGRPLVRFDAHLDPVDWRGTRSAVAAQPFVDRIVDLLEQDAPIGLMTHHLVHDDAIWDLVEAVVRRIAAGGGFRVSLPALLDAAAADSTN